jgi:arginine decarboxylase
MGLRLHMPGHAGGKGIGDMALQQLAQLDVTEVPGLGDLHILEGIMEEARVLLAQAYGAEQSLFLVNGASSGIHTMFMSLPPGQRVLVPRNAHRSFYAGMILSGVEPLYIPGRISTEYGWCMSVSSHDIINLLNAHPDVRSIFLTSPNYLGVSCDLKEICARVRDLNRPISVFVDEAHGGHFPFHPAYPTPALRAGADAVVNGLHKTLPVLNQGACLHVQDEDYFYRRILPAWSLLTTSSPSYPILASIDLARSLMMLEGEYLLEKALDLSRFYKGKINTIKGLSVLTEEQLINWPGAVELDPLKLLINTGGISLSGLQMASILRDKYSIQVEMYGANQVLAMMSMFHQAQDWELFYRALKDIAWQYPAAKGVRQEIKPVPEPQVVVTPREAYFSKNIEVRLSDCLGKISAEMIAPYPPGIPCLLPGELISQDIYEYLLYLKKQPVSLHGPEDRSLRKIRIIEK